MRYIGLDLGTKTCGVAISDKLGIIASFYKTIFFKEEDYESLINPINEIIKEYNIEKIVLGLPKNMNNTVGFAGERSISFKKILEDNLKLEVILEDERLSSVEANNIMIKSDISRNKRKKKVDGLAATIILQRYLDRKDK
ncbi:MAG: Holliday junction resolvase RuvX [Bacilli bacterium]|nr:Holliday junction resolvase RuvX [Bacilli bacterium]